MKLRRLRTFTLWTGTLLCVLIAAAFVVSAWWGFVVSIPGGPYVLVMSGLLAFELQIPKPSVFVWPHDLGLALWATFGPGAYWHVPLWMPFLAVAVPTLLAWRFWLKPPKPGHCRCGYNLTGNESGKCPECGQPFEPKGDAP